MSSNRFPSRSRSILVLVAMLVGAGACSSGDGTAETVPGTPVVTEPAPTTTATIAPTTTTTATTTTTTTTIPEDPWTLVAPPAPPAAEPESGFAALASAETFCIRLDVDDGTPAPETERVAEILTLLGYTVVENGCDASLDVSLAGQSSPADYSGDLTCYLQRTVTGALTLSVGDESLATWNVDEFDGAPMSTTEFNCPGPDDPVGVGFWTRSLQPILYETFGNTGLAVYEVTGGYRDLSGAWLVLESAESQTAFLADPRVMLLFASYLGPGPLTNDQVWFVEDITGSLDSRGMDPPAGAEILLPVLLASVTDDDTDELEIDRGWEAISWITGITERDPDAVWAWYAALQQ